MPYATPIHMDAVIEKSFGISCADPKGGGGKRRMKYNQGTIVPGFSYAPPLAQTRKCLDSLWGIKKPDYVRLYFISFAERKGFEPSIRFPVYTLSRRAPSTTRTPLCVPKDLYGSGGANLRHLALFSEYFKRAT